MGFWDKAAGYPPQQPTQTHAVPAQRPWWQAPEPAPAMPPPGVSAPPAQQYAAAPPGYEYQGQQLAVQGYGPRADPVVDHIQAQGFIKKPPKWVQKQPTQTCPECGGPNFAMISEDQYGEMHGGKAFLRCFDCGHNNYSIHENALSGTASSGPVVGSARQTATGGANLRNFGEITGVKIGR